MPEADATTSHPTDLPSAETRQHPLVSIVIPTYNRAAFFAEALHSAVAQTYPNVEIIVADDASTDATPEVCQAYAGDPRVKIHRHENNLGPNGNWQYGLQVAAGAYVGILADDDVHEPTFVERLMAPVQRDPSLDVVFSDHWIVDADGSVKQEATERIGASYGRGARAAGVVDDTARAFFIDKSVYIGAVLFRKEVLTQQPLHPKARSAMGAWLLYQAFRSGAQAFYVPERLMHCRWVKGSVSRSQRFRLGLLRGNVFRLRTQLQDERLRAYHPALRAELVEEMGTLLAAHIARGELQEAWDVLKALRREDLSLAEVRTVIVCLLNPLRWKIERLIDGGP
jgi:glycosyltransferase involved in cell wall biosynthesis